MKLFNIALVLLVLLVCVRSEGNGTAVLNPTIGKNYAVPKSDLLLNQLEGTWYYKGDTFSGRAVDYHPNGTMSEELRFLDGKRQGTGKRWSGHGVLRAKFHYQNNKLHGRYKSWWESGVLASEHNYAYGLLQGKAKDWHANGQLAKLRNFNKGLEHGMQQAWLNNGKLYINYEAKNGRIYGMRRANSCYQLENEVVVRSK